MHSLQPLDRLELQDYFAFDDHVESMGSQRLVSIDHGDRNFDRDVQGVHFELDPERVLIDILRVAGPEPPMHLDGAADTPGHDLPVLRPFVVSCSAFNATPTLSR